MYGLPRWTSRRVNWGVTASLALPLSLPAQDGGKLPITCVSQEARTLFERARDLTENAETVLARPLLDQALGKEPDFAMAHAVRAVSGGGFQVQRDHLKKAVDLAGKVSPAERAWILGLQAQFEGASAEQGRQVAELLRLAPADPHVRLAAAFYFQGGPADSDTSLQHLRKALEIDPAYAPAYNLLGYTFTRVERFDEAEKALQQYIKVRPGKPNPHDSYAEFLLTRGRYDDSITQYKKALEAQATFVSGHAGIGHNLVFKGEFAKSRAAYQRMFEAANGPGEKLAALYWKAVSYLHEGDVTNALTALEDRRLLAQKEGQFPGEINSQWSMAFIRMESGNLAACAKGLEKTGQSLASSGVSPALKTVWGHYLDLAWAQVFTRAHAFEASQALLDRVRAAAEQTQDATLKRGVETGLGELALESHHPDKALAHFAKGDREDPYLWYLQSQAWGEKGDAAKAAEWRQKVLGCNQNSLELASVRRLVAK